MASDWLKTDESMKKKYEDFAASNKKFASKFDTYEKFIKEMDNDVSPEKEKTEETEDKK